MSESSMLSMSEPSKTGRLQAFIAEEEDIGAGPIGEVKFDETASAIIRTPQAWQTCRSPKRKGKKCSRQTSSSGKRLKN